MLNFNGEQIHLFPKQIHGIKIHEAADLKHICDGFAGRIFIRVKDGNTQIEIHARLNNHAPKLTASKNADMCVDVQSEKSAANIGKRSACAVSDLCGSCSPKRGKATLSAMVRLSST